MIEIDWAKRNDAVPVRVSKHDEKSIFRFCDVVTKQNAALYYDNKKLVRGSVHVLSFLVRQFPFESGDPFTEGLRCDLILNPNPGANQEEVLLAMKVYEDYIAVSVLSDIPTLLRSDASFFFMTNYLCSSDKLPFYISSGIASWKDNSATVLINDSVRPVTHKGMRKFVKRFFPCIVSEGNDFVGVYGKEGSIGRKELQKEHSDYFERQDAFSPDLIKDGKVYISDVPEDKSMFFFMLRIHNDTDGVISCDRAFFIEPHGVEPIFFEDFSCGQFQASKKAGDDWKTKVWFECPNGKSPKMYKFFSKEEVVNKRRKRKVLEQMEYGTSADEKEILKALCEKDPKDWIKTILEFGKKSNAIDKSEIKIGDKKEDPKVEEKNYSVMKKAPKKIKRANINK